VLGAFFLLFWLGIGILFRLSWGNGELGATKDDQLGAYEDFSAAAPFVLRVITATSDPAMDPAKPSDHFESVAVEVTMPNGLSYLAKRLDGDHVVDLQDLGGDRFGDDFPSDCRIAPCTRTYVLVACWTDPPSQGGRSGYMGASIRAAPVETSGASVALSPTPDLLPAAMADDLARQTGCEGHA
jgi:hypothetical protein